MVREKRVNDVWQWWRQRFCGGNTYITDIEDWGIKLMEALSVRVYWIWMFNPLTIPFDVTLVWILSKVYSRFFLPVFRSHSDTARWGSPSGVSSWSCQQSPWSWKTREWSGIGTYWRCVSSRHPYVGGRHKVMRLVLWWHQWILVWSWQWELFCDFQ